MNYEPHKVPFAFKTWAKESIELMIRNYQIFLIYIAGVMLVAYISSAFDLLNIIFPYVLGVGTLIAYSADKSEPVIKLFKSKTPIVWIRLLIIGGVLYFINYIFNSINFGEEMFLPEPSEPLIIPQLFISIMANITIFTGLFGFIFITLVPLIVVSELSIKRAWIQTMDSLFINASVIFTFTFASAFLNIFIGIASKYAVLPWLCFVSTMMYVLYRHIWFDKPKNEKKKIKASQPIQTITASN